MKDGENVDLYYGIKIVDYELSGQVTRLAAEKAFISVSCTALNNATSGDIKYEAYQFALEEEKVHEEGVGFSTASAALHNPSFLVECKLSFILKYMYRGSDWVFDRLYVGYGPEAFDDALRRFPQNEHFRKAVGIAD